MEAFDEALKEVMAQIQAGNGVVGTAGLTPLTPSGNPPVT